MKLCDFFVQVKRQKKKKKKNPKHFQEYNRTPKNKQFSLKTISTTNIFPAKKKKNILL
jgi:hypothetical protein